MPANNFTAKPIQIPGPCKVFVQVPWAVTQDLLELGEATDSIDIQEIEYFHNVVGDANGGPQGPPIDVQTLGMMHRVSLDLSRWDYAVAQQIRRRGRTLVGEVDALEVGKLHFETLAVRVLLDPQDPAKRPTWTRNYWCCIFREPIAYGLGTKYAQLQCQFEAHRPPANHGKEGIIWDADRDPYSP